MRERGIDRIEAHVAGACIGNGLGPVRVLGLQRSRDRQLFPGLWEGVGGQVRIGQTFEEAARTHLSDEAGLTGKVLLPFASYAIEPTVDGTVDAVIPGVRFLIKIDGTPPARINAAQHQAWAWVEEAEIDSVDWIPGLKHQLRVGIKLYKQLHFLGED